MFVSFKELAIGEIYMAVDFDDPHYKTEFVKIDESHAKDCQHGAVYACDGDEIVKVGN